MLELLYTVFRAIVNEPDQVQITWLGDCECLTYKITVAPSDVGRVVGKGGRIIKAIRILVQSVAMKHNHQVYVTILSDSIVPADSLATL